MGYGCQKDFHIDDYLKVFRRTSPVKRTWERRSPEGLQYTEPDPLTPQQKEYLLNLGALGLAGEGGEVVDLIKKHLFHDKPLDRAKLIEELGDQLWYFQCCLEAIDGTFEEVAEANDKKLKRRYPKGFEPGGGNR
jgi:NTP pyrophosphatase (non-canonical NTP hydrolase)